ncbi:hypothetical protein [Bythopirellula goksoeyrii]|uniref:PEP-CTERM protein-sorting domain-containing protein n=1 Tax=Bythopirellula goksoeyrii TaxID=1400387 RepID=A0A5B9QIH6_9BACT|nr:hypothetical protein [Bythopirellula goksoeyrii]QEG34031.1 hypothetical protein Pr1d_13030 [Bythopirellula goksoeyrii]
MEFSRFFRTLLTCPFIMGLCPAIALAAAPTPQKIFAVSQTQPGGVAEIPGAPSDSLIFYDVTDIGNGASSGVFNNDPLFSVWMGFEIFEGERNELPEGLPAGNREEFSAFTFNPANGTIYAAAFDSGAPSALDGVGDTQGDFDLYRIDYQSILKDFTDNARPKGTIYAPKTLNITTANEQFLSDISSPLFDGLVDGLANDIPHPSLVNTVHLPGAFQKIGEVGRSQSSTSFFDYQIDFLNPETLLLMDANFGTTDPATQDFNIRTLSRASTSQGAATIPPDLFPNTPTDQQGGFNSVNNTESWNSKIAGFLNLDAAGITTPRGWTLVKNNGTLGIWAADSDGGGDDFAFYELDLSGPNPTATKKELFTSPTGGPYANQISLAEDPTSDTTTNDGEIDHLFVDKNGNLVIVESGFFDTTMGSTTPPLGNGGETAQEPRVFTVGIADYNSPDSDGSGFNEVVPTGPAGTGFNDSSPWAVTASIPVTGAIDNDDDVTNSTRVAYDKSTGYLYIVDQDTGFTEDIYVFDPATGTIVYSELNPFDIGIFNRGTLKVFTRGDIDGSGEVTYADIQALADGIADPTLGGTVSASVGAEWYDLTGDASLTAADVTELVENILGTKLGDFDLDGDVDGNDFLVYQRGPQFDAGDLADWQLNYGFSNMAPLASGTAVPEPAAVSMILLGLAGMSIRGRNR